MASEYIRYDDNRVYAIYYREYKTIYYNLQFNFRMKLIYII